jgi:hypothetical protein
MIPLQTRPLDASFLLLIFLIFSPAIPYGGGTPFRASDEIGDAAQISVGDEG